MIEKAKIFIQVVAIAGLATALTNCITRGVQDSSAYDVDLHSRLKTDGLAFIDWPCAGKGKQHPAGANSQEEYCEWTRKFQSFSGLGAQHWEAHLVRSMFKKPVFLPPLLINLKSFT